MEKRNLIESDRTPDLDKQANLDTTEREAVEAFRKCCTDTVSDQTKADVFKHGLKSH